MRAAQNQPQNRLIWPSSGSRRPLYLKMPTSSSLARRQTDDLQGQSAAARTLWESPLTRTALRLHCSCSLSSQQWVPLGFGGPPTNTLFSTTSPGSASERSAVRLSSDDVAKTGRDLKSCAPLVHKEFNTNRFPPCNLANYKLHPAL